MFTDLVGYSASSQQDEAHALHLLEKHRTLVRPLLTRHGGREVKTIGDAFLVEFASALAAVTSAIEIQQACHEHNRQAAPRDQILMRIGLHVGDIVPRGSDIFGDGVNIAARIEPLAEPGGICVSEDVARQIGNKTPFPLVRLGSGELKNISLPVEIYQVVLPWSRVQSDVSSRLSFSLRKKSTRRILLATGIGLGLLAVGLFRTSGQQAPPPPANRLAVLPLVNYSGDPKDEYFADGMTEELISTLATLREIDVIARTSITRFKGSGLDLAAIGRTLNVGSVLEGSVRIAGDQARIDIRLVDTTSQRTLWSQAYSRLIKDVFAVQSSIAESVTEVLKVRLHTGEKDLIERRGTENSEAYRQFLLGRTHLNRRTGDEVMKAIGYFTRSTELDPAFALAYAGLAEGYTLAGSAGYGSLPRARCNELAREAATKAVTLDDSLAEAHAAMGYVRFRIDWDWVGAEKAFQRALVLKPGYARAHEWYALYLSVRHRFAASLAEMQRAQQLDPLSASVSNGVGRILHFDRRFDEALLHFRRTLELDPDYAEAYFSQSMTYLAMHRHDDAIAALKIALRLSGNRPVMMAMLGMMEGFAGHLDQARKIYAEMQSQARTGEVSPYYFGLICVGLGEKDQAFAYFEQALAEHEGIMIYLGIEPVTESLQHDPRYASLLTRMNLQP